MRSALGGSRSQLRGCKAQGRGYQLTAMQQQSECQKGVARLGKTHQGRGLAAPCALLPQWQQRAQRCNQQQEVFRGREPRWAALKLR